MKVKTKLSKNFYYEEFLKSTIASRHKIKNVPYDVQFVKDNLVHLCGVCLQPIRDRFGPVKVTSGFRSLELNEKIGGSANSDHLRGSAADITLGVDLAEVAEWASRRTTFHKLILERHGKSTWLHCSAKIEENRHQVLTFVDGTYYEGLRVDKWEK